MSNYRGIAQALINAIDDLALGYPTGYPDAELQKDQRGTGIWLQIYVLPTSSDPVTLGNRGEDDHNGILQVDINQPKGLGAGPLYTVADTIANALPAGKGLIYDGQGVKIMGSSLSPGRFAGGDYRVSLSVNYNARTQRNLEE